MPSGNGVYIKVPHKKNKDPNNQGSTRPISLKNQGLRIDGYPAQACGKLSGGVHKGMYNNCQ